MIAQVGALFGRIRLNPSRPTNLDSRDEALYGRHPRVTASSGSAEPSREHIRLELLEELRGICEVCVAQQGRCDVGPSEDDSPYTSLFRGLESSG